MLNIQKYEKEIAEYGLDNFTTIEGSIISCGEVLCDECDFNCGACEIERLEWLLKGETETTDKDDKLTETNYDHHEKEIRRIGFDGFGVGKDGAVRECKRFANNCENCIFNDDVDPCSEIKITWLDDFYQPIPDYSEEEMTLLKILKEGTLYKDINGTICHADKYKIETKIPDTWDYLQFDNLDNGNVLDISAELKRIGEF